jgi:hypothetical protein
MFGWTLWTYSAAVKEKEKAAASPESGLNGRDSKRKNVDVYEKNMYSWLYNRLWFNRPSTP